MPVITTQTPDERSASRYEMIRNALRDAIRQGQAAPGLVLVEAPLAQIFGTSRVPVRKALHLLHEEGLLSRFDGRGYLVNPAQSALAPLRTPLTPEALGLSDIDELIDNRSLGERIHDELTACVSTFMVFGHYRLDEQVAAETLGVSRAIVREALMRIRDRGLVEKEPYAQWLTGPLTAQAVRDDYELRALLEPEALRQRAPFISRDTLSEMLDRVIAAQQPGVNLRRSALARIEQDLHRDLLADLDNQKMAAAIRQAQGAMNINPIIHATLRMSTDEAMLREHRLVLEALLYGAIDTAALSLKDHLQRACRRAQQRLKVLSVLPEPELPPFLTRLA
ncbi:GntR family transcriptional regulator [Pseudomonas sp. S 311-6]|nr:GntR family transcriptional regulator [Pseudomonas sp. S 311-6]